MRKIIVVLLLVLIPVYAGATKYYENTFESYSCGVVNPAGFYYQNIAPYLRCSDKTPDGTKYLEYETPANPGGAYTEIDYTNHAITPGQKLYAAVYVNISRKNGLDVFHEGNLQSYSKYIDLFIGNGGVRLALCLGQQQGECTSKFNADHKFTVWVMQGIYPNIACFDGHIWQNYGGYGSTNPIQLDYDRWHSVVAGCTFSNGAGTLELWVDGIKVMNYTGVNVTYSGSPSINRIQLMGTIAQPAYDAPSHYDRYDHLLITDDWNDILNGGFMQDPAGGIPSAPSAPTGLRIVQ